MVEIERKFLVDKNKWQPAEEGIKIKQGYLSAAPNITVRIRIAGKQAFLTIKGKTERISRPEFEYEIPVEEADSIMEMCLHPPVEKTRHIEYHDGLKWEIDLFEGANKGLVMAEVELENENQTVNLPSWILKEVSGDRRYFNSWLSQHPFTTWE